MDIPTFWSARVAVLATAALAGVAQAGINTRCLNSDAAAQTRLLAYDAEPALSAGNAVAATPSNATTATAVKPTVDGRTAVTAYEMSPDRLLDWQRWPALKLSFDDRAFEFLGVHLTDKDDPARCIRLMLRVLEPVYREISGFGYLRSEYEGSDPKQIELRAAAGKLRAPVFAVGNPSSQFFVIDLKLLRANEYWKRRYELFRRNAEATRNPKAYPVHFERFLLNVIRFSRYPFEKMPAQDRNRFVEATFRALQRGGTDCQSTPDHALCVLNAIFMETELGSAHPLKVTDALDNSGLAFGPRQLDLGQDRKDATEFARRYLISSEKVDEKWPSRFLKPVEALPRRDFHELYVSVIPELNEKLSIHGERVIDLYIDGLRHMVGADYRLDRLNFTGKAKLLALLIAADFGNKWGEDTARAIVGGLDARTSYDECGILAAWTEAVKRRLAPGDVEDFRRRVGHVATHLAKVTTPPWRACS